MPHPDSSRMRAVHEQWSEPNAGWPVDPAAPRHLAPRPRRSSRRREHIEDCRHAADIDGNEEQERQKREAAAPSSRMPALIGGMPDTLARGRNDEEADDDDRWVASRPFTLDDELEDTWPNLPPRQLDD